MKKVTVTGGGGFIGAHLTRKLVIDNWDVSIIDNMIRGDDNRLLDIKNQIRVHDIDIRDEDRVANSIKGSDLVIHLAAVNGTENFYKHPELVLDVGIRGALSVVNACRRSNVYDLIVASSAEVYQTPEIIPTPENIPLMLPNSINPRYSYGGSKIISELIALNYGQEHFRKIQIFRPHNVYGPDMGWKHVIPQFINQALLLSSGISTNTPPFIIQGDGNETRAFCYVDDIVNGILKMYEKGLHREIYNIGNDQEISIKELVKRLFHVMDIDFEIKGSENMAGGTPRRCPDITKMRAMGYNPCFNLETGLKETVNWYKNNPQTTKNNLM